jgi:hypothetical protein
MDERLFLQLGWASIAMRTKRALAVVLVGMCAAPNVLAGNYEFEGNLRDGRTVSFSTEPPSRVAVFQRQKDGSIEDYIAYENEGCEVISTKLRCSVTGKSPLAGTTYEFKRLVGGERKDCVRKPVYALYECISGCGNLRPAPSSLMEISVCE